jgi:hypothetical protein
MALKYNLLHKYYIEEEYINVCADLTPVQHIKSIV